MESKEEQQIKKEKEKDMEEKKIEEKTKEKKKEKTEAIAVIGFKKAKVRGKDLPISTKYAVAICDFIRGKNPRHAITLLEKVLNKKIALPIKGEIPHRRNMPKARVSGRYPIKASKEFIKLLKSLIANANIKGINADDLIIALIKADKASRPYRAARLAFGRKRFKRTNVIIEAELKTAEKKQNFSSSQI